MNNILKIEVPNRFQRSIRIDSDFNDIDILESFINSNTANRALEDLCHHISSAGQCSFTWTGPYGSGKSSFYNAFYWCLYEKIYITDEGWQKKPEHESIVNYSSLKSLKIPKSVQESTEDG